MDFTFSMLPVRKPNSIEQLVDQVPGRDTPGALGNVESALDRGWGGRWLALGGELDCGGETVKILSLALVLFLDEGVLDVDNREEKEGDEGSDD